MRGGNREERREAKAQDREAEEVRRASDEPTVRVIRSERRRRTVSGRRVGEVLEVRVPAGLSVHEEARFVEQMVGRLMRPTRVRPIDDTALLRRAKRLARTYLGVETLPVRSVRYVDMATRWGSATPQDGSIRLSQRLTDLPAWVEDYVIVHEAAHLVLPRAGHSARFWRLVAGYPRAERARGYLLAVAALDRHGAGRGLAGPDGSSEDEEDPVDDSDAFSGDAP